MSDACVAVLGAGRMGRGIALSFACAGHEIVVIDAKERSASEFEQLRDDALRDIGAQIEVLVDLEIVPPGAVRRILARIEVSNRDAACDRLSKVDLLFEGVPEVMAAKSQALAFADRWLPARAIVASTSSTFVSTSLATMVSSPQRFLNAHWLNPAHLIPLVELSPHQGTELQVTQRLQRTLESIGKVAVLCTATPGYIVPRLQALLMNEAARMIEEGVATAEDIDRATRYGFGIRYAAMGVVEFIDVGGNDILYYASRYLSEALGDQRYASPEIVGRLMAQGQNGLRSGKGFYDWSDKDIGVYRRQSTARLIELLRIANRLPVVTD